MAKENYDILNQEQLELLLGKINKALGKRYSAKFYTQWAGSVYVCILESNAPIGVAQYFGTAKDKEFFDFLTIEGRTSIELIEKLTQAGIDYNNEVDFVKVERED